MSPQGHSAEHYCCSSQVPTVIQLSRIYMCVYNIILWNRPFSGWDGIWNKHASIFNTYLFRNVYTLEILGWGKSTLGVEICVL